MTDSKMPERIWAQPEHTDDPAYGGFWIKSKVAPSVAYIRADLAHPTPAPELHRSFPEAGDGRPMPPMGDELMTAGLNPDDARFVAVQLAQNGLTLVPAPVAGADLEPCGKCMGSGYGGHPDSGYVCYECNGSGGVSLRARTSQPVGVMSAATNDVLSERQRQISAEGWTPEHDDEHGGGEMAKAASCYAWFSAQSETLRAVFETPPPVWPEEWSQQWWKPTNRRRDLVKAGALILAEIERLDRAALLPDGGVYE